MTTQANAWLLWRLAESGQPEFLGLYPSGDNEQELASGWQATPVSFIGNDWSLRFRELAASGDAQLGSRVTVSFGQLEHMMARLGRWPGPPAPDPHGR
jgi:hypothetical protein